MFLPFDSYAQLLIAITAAAFGGFLRGLTGFGSALVMAPLLASTLGPVHAVALSVAFGFVATVHMAPRYIDKMDTGGLVPMAVAGAAAVAPGVWVLHWASAEVMRTVIALLTIAVAAILVLRPTYRARRTGRSALAAGALGGAAMGATSMGGPPIVLHLISRDRAPERNKADVIAMVGLLELCALTAFALIGDYTVRLLWQAAAMAPVFIAATFLGERLFRRARERYRDVALYALMGAGAVALLR